MTRSRINIVLALLLGGFIGLSARPAAAQSDSQLRNENARLKTENAELGRELKAARDRLKELEDRIAVLEAIVGSNPSTTPVSPTTPAEPKVSIDESESNASPRALLREMTKRYEEETAERAVGVEQSSARIAYLRAVNQWSTRTNRQYREPIEWLVNIQDVKRTDRGYMLRVVAIDPKFDTLLGPPFYIQLPKNRARKLEQDNTLEKLVLRGVLRPLISVNPQRETPGAFNIPKLIGPFVEFGLTVDVASLQPREEVAVEGSGDGSP